MVQKLDSAVAAALSLDDDVTSIQTIGGGSGFANIYKITTTLNGRKRHFFMKTGFGEDAVIMFKGEHASLNAIHSTVPSLCPASLATGRLSSKDGAFLVTEYIDDDHERDHSGGAQNLDELDSKTRMSLAEKLAKLHTTPAPIPEGMTKPVFGFPVTTCCGNTAQRNDYKESWAEFFTENRLRSVLMAGEQKNGADRELQHLVDETGNIVVPRLLADGHLGGLKGVMPVVVHGDLWSGNKTEGYIDGTTTLEDIIFDPSSSYAHCEFELGIMRLFGFADNRFWNEYEKLVPKTQPIEEFEDRLELYKLYHQLNHYAIFGGGYRSGAISIMKKLLKKYNR